MDFKKLKKPAPKDVNPKDNPSDYTSDKASDRFLYLNFRFLKYGTNDKFQGAAILFSFFIFILIIFTITMGFIFPSACGWSEKCLGWLQNTFILIIGVAIGKSLNGSK
ncbi:MAG: hypothetical protein KR126chlam5_00194 [Candidatus Anoxychlamydiales bacterium]|nr:hypothetical protein [Candidatus Anoxychlamydiales bacterium]